MKIDITELPKIRELLDELQKNVWVADQLSRPHPTAEFKVEDREKNEMHTLSHAELLNVFKARVEAGCKHFMQRYQIEFKYEFPLSLFRPTTVDGVDVTVAEEGAQA